MTSERLVSLSYTSAVIHRSISACTYTHTYKSTRTREYREHRGNSGWKDQREKPANCCILLVNLTGTSHSTVIKWIIVFFRDFFQSLKNVEAERDDSMNHWETRLKFSNNIICHRERETSACFTIIDFFKTKNGTWKYCFSTVNYFYLIHLYGLFFI